MTLKNMHQLYLAEETD